MNPEDQPFWKTKTLSEMTPKEWESLCDGCARCCLIKFEDEDTGAIGTTNVACKLLDLETCRCTRYPDRSRLVPMCVTLTPELAGSLHWMPDTCAYKLLAHGKDLPWWHPLVSGSKESVHLAGISIRGMALSEEDVEEEDLLDYVMDWPEDLVE